MRKQIAVLSLVVGILVFSSAGFAGPQVLEVSPTYLEFTAYEGGANPSAQVLSIWNSGHGPMDWTVTPDCNWITLDPNSGESGGDVDDVDAIVDINGLAEGMYNCQLTVTGSGAPNSPQIVDVNLVVYQPIIELSATQFEFAAVEGGVNPADQILNISNSGTGTLNWEITEYCDWLSAVPTSGSSTGEVDDVNLSVDVSGLTAGVYDCNLTVSDPNAENSPQTVVISLSVYAYYVEGALHVPLEYPTIQAAIDASVDGNTVVVALGTYVGAGNKNLDFGGKAITVQSIDPDNPGAVTGTVVDCENSGRGFYFHSGEGQDSILAGLTITRGNILGNPGKGGGIYLSGSSPTIENCVIIDNTARGGGDGIGGGIYCTSDSNLTIQNCTISDNTAKGGNGCDGIGGGIYCTSDSNLTIQNCTISDNNALGGDGGGEPPIIGGRAYGGGICGNVTITNSTISGNSAEGGTSPFIAGGRARGGGMYCLNSSSIINCLIINNLIDGRQSVQYSLGGAIYGNSTSDLTITNSTICNNTSVLDPWFLDSGGVACEGTSTITDCILWGNDDDLYGCSATYSCIEDGDAGVGNISGDPCFVSGPDGDYYLSQTAAGQAVDSPCVDAGSDTAANLGMDIFTTRTDIVGDGGTVDMGYHYPMPNPADIDGDGYVDFVDFAILASQYQQSPGVPSADIAPPGGNGIVDIWDLGVFTQNWLKGVPGIGYEISPCNMNSSAAERPGQTRFSVTVQGSYIHFEDMMVANCCPDELWLEMTLEDNLITIYEHEYLTTPCFCICDYPVTATLGPFEPGSYTIEVYEDFGGFVGSTTVAIE